MNKSKTGGKDDSASVSIALPHRKLDTSLKRRVPKQFELESKKLTIDSDSSDGQFVVKMANEKNSTVGSQTRMLTKSEIDSLRKTKQSVAARAMFSFKRA